MADFRDIDAFFNGEKPFEDKNGERLGLRARVLRFLKLIMPSFAAVLIALLLLLPTLKKNNSVDEIDVTLPKKGELEKLHIEQTEFAITDKNNKVSVFTADRIDETTPGSQLMKIINPKGTIPVGKNDDLVKIDSDVAYFNQQENIVKAEQNVKAVYDDGTTVLTEQADYDFNKSYGVGNKDVYAYGSWGKLWADGFEYYQNDELLVLVGKSKIVSDERTLWANRQVRYYKLQNKMEAEGNVKFVESNNVLYADKLIAMFEGKEPSEIKQVEAYGNVVVITNDGTAKGDYGIYRPKTAQIELYGNVILEQDGNVVHGQKAITNLNTSVSRIISAKNSKNSAGRVSGVIKGSTVKGKKNEKK